MGCSPYFVFTLIALLTFITMRWWSLSGQNDELERRIRGLQNEIVLEQGNIKKLDASLAQLRSSGDTLNSEKTQLQKEMNSLNEQVRVLQNERNRLEEEKTEAEGETDDLRNDLAKWKERDVAATLNRNNQVEAANARVAELEKELAECGKVGEEPKLPKGFGIQKPDGASARMEGQLNDVDPSAVKVEAKAVEDTDGGNAGESKPQDELKETGVEVRGGTAAENEEGSDVQDKEAVAVVRDNAEEEEEIKISQDRRPDVRAADVDEEKQVISPPGDNNFEDDEDQGQEDPVDPSEDDEGEADEDNPTL